MTELKTVDLQGVSGGFGFPRRRVAARPPAQAAPATTTQAANIFPAAPAGAPGWAQAMAEEANQYAATHSPTQGGGQDGTQTA